MRAGRKKRRRRLNEKTKGNDKTGERGKNRADTRPGKKHGKSPTR